MYKHLDLLEELTEVARTNDKPWEEFQTALIVLQPEYHQCTSMRELFDDLYTWRRKPKTPEKQVDDVMNTLEQKEPMIPLSELNALRRTLPANMWIKASEVDALILKYTPATKTVIINGVRLKEDRYTEDDRPEIGAVYYIESMTADDYFSTFRYGLYDFDNQCIEREIAHKTPEGAAAFTKARLE